MRAKRQIKKVFIVYKHSIYQKYVVREKNEHLIRLLKARHPTTRHLVTRHEAHTRAIDLVKKTLTRLGIRYRISARSHLKYFDDVDLVITIGGDGTLLRSAHFVTDQLLIGINSDPESSVGALCSLDAPEFPKKMEAILNGHYDVKGLHRIRIRLNNKKLPIEPINDVLFTNISPAATSRYLIELERKREEHKSSGIWIATPLGSTAAIHAAGGPPQPGHDERLQFLTREPYQGIYNPYELTKGFIEKNKRLKIVSLMIKSRLYLDGPVRFFTIEYGDTLSFQWSPDVVRMIV